MAVSSPKDSAKMSDLLAIRDVQNQYGVAIDFRQWHDLEQCFSAECDIDYGVRGRWSRASDFVRWAAEYHEPLGPTLHQMSSHTATVTSASATASCYVHALLTTADRASATHVYARYQDELTKADGIWVIVHRSTESIWRESSSP